MERLMKQMGVKQEDVEALEVVIRCPDKEIVIKDPSVGRVEMMGQETWQITGFAEERELDPTPDISEEDVKTVMEQAGCSLEEARQVLEETKGDLAGAILRISKED